jgi:multiple PDZ domain protein
MHSSNVEISNAQTQIELIKQAIEDSNDPSLQLETLDDLQLILDVLEDPIFRNLIQIQDSIRELNGQIQQHPSILPGDFDIDIAGDLIINVPPSSDIYDAEYRDEQRVPSAQISPNSPATKNVPYNMSSVHDDSMDSDGILGYDDNVKDMLPNIHTTATLVKNSHDNVIDYNTSGKESGDEEREIERPQSATSNSSKHASDLMASEWTQVQAIELVNDGTGLGFGIIGSKTAGVIVKTILPGGVADRDGRLLSGDHILQIGDVNLHYFQSEQVASVLRQSGTHVRLIVARPVDPMKVNKNVECSAIVPSRFMADPNELQNYLAAAGYPDIFGISSTPSTPSLKNEKISFKEELEKINLINLELPETERFTVELTKDFNGLGITIAGYVCEKEELSGIFVKSVSPGSAADVSGKIRVNDRIIEVDGQSLQGFSNHQAVDVLKQSGSVVKLCLERYLRGPKYEQLQQAIAANETKPQTPNTPPPQSVPTRVMGSTVSPMSSSRRSSLTKYANTEDLTQELTASGRMQRKFIQARDSIEKKPIMDHAFGQESSVDNEEDLINELAGTMQQHHIYNVQPIRKEPIMENLSTASISKLHKYYVDSKLTKDQEMGLIKKWKSVLGVDSNIIVAQIRKFAASSGLGISLEGTVDVEGGREVRPHHYIRSILEEGPVGQNGLLRSGDELLEVNNQRLLGMNHMEVVSILKELPQDVRMVCRRGGPEVIAFTEENVIVGYHESSGSKNVQVLLPSDRLVKAKSDGSLATGAGNGDGFSKMKSRSVIFYIVYYICYMSFS